jgi:hypothetical protein
MTSPELNHILDIANDHNIIVRGAIAAYMLWFLVMEFVVNHTPYTESRIVLSGVRRWAIWIGVAIFLWALGAEVLTIGVKLWRGSGLILGFWLMLIGSAITVIGGLMLLRSVSIKQCGEWFWCGVLAVVVEYTVWSVLG